MDTSIIEVEQKALTMPEKAIRLQVVDQPTFKAICEFREVLKAIQKEIDEAFDPIISKAHQAHKEACAQKKKAEGPILEAKKIIEPKISQYLDEQERIRKQEELRLAEIARKAEEEAKLSEAAAYEAAGDKETAEEIINEPIKAQAFVLPKATLNTGINMRETWSAEVTSLTELVRAAANGIIPIQAVEGNMQFLNSEARGQKDKWNWPGVKAISKKSIY